MNHYILGTDVNWGEFGNNIVKKLMEYKNNFYVKKDLYKYMNIKLDDKYIDQDYLTLKNTRINIIPEETKVLQPTLF
jgi:hypothetical protein